MQEDPPGRQWRVAENAINFKTLLKSFCCVFFFGLKTCRRACYFLIFCCHFLDFQHSGWNPSLRTPKYSDSFVCRITNQISTNPKLPMLPRGVVPKKDGIWCLITDISSLLGSSIYYYITKEAFTLHYATFHQALSLVRRHGPRGKTKHQTRLPTLPSLPGETRATRHALAGQLLHSPPPLWLTIPFLAPCPLPLLF